MPTIRMTVPHGDLTTEQKAEAVQRLTETVSKFFHEQKQEDVSSFVMVQISETSEGGYALGGEVIG